MNRETKENILGIVGPDSAGKSTLINQLKELGYNCRHIAQEHSYVPDMWLRLVNPLALIYLDVTYIVSLERRQLDMNEREFNEQKDRLLHAYQNADLYIQTDELSAENVYSIVVQYLENNIFFPSK
jgi:thymidylate kinase